MLNSGHIRVHKDFEKALKDKYGAFNGTFEMSTGRKLSFVEFTRFMALDLRAPVIGGNSFEVKRKRGRQVSLEPRSIFPL